ncbi:MAG: hypothetical protein C0594_09810 [Marinilabiliales bacterium]|nr:MAG: hypothetical protein C0594_09810 [Marinilabiliales bacterium]
MRSAMLFLGFIIILTSCKKNKDELNANKTENNYYSLLVDKTQWIPFSEGDTIQYIDSIGNILTFFVDRSEHFITTVSFEDLNYQYPVNVIDEYENYILELASNEVCWKIAYELNATASSETQFKLTSALSENEVCSVGNQKLLFIDNNQIRNTSSIAFHDSITILNREFYQVFEIMQNTTLSSIFYTQNFGIVAFTNIENGSAKSYRIN